VLGMEQSRAKRKNRPRLLTRCCGGEPSNAKTSPAANAVQPPRLRSVEVLTTARHAVPAQKVREQAVLST
jgi:hypothetical protein